MRRPELAALALTRLRLAQSRSKIELAAAAQHCQHMLIIPALTRDSGGLGCSCFLDNAAAVAVKFAAAEVRAVGRCAACVVATAHSAVHAHVRGFGSHAACRGK